MLQIQQLSKAKCKNEEKHPANQHQRHAVSGDIIQFEQARSNVSVPPFMVTSANVAFLPYLVILWDLG